MINNKLQNIFRNFIEGRFEEGPNRDFAIQYSVFEKMNYEEENTWYFNYVDSGMSCDDGLYEIDVQYSDRETKVKIHSWKGNHDGFKIKELSDYREESLDENIYAIDLYPEYMLKNFKGSAYTRGGYIGWNHIDENIDSDN